MERKSAPTMRKPATRIQCRPKAFLLPDDGARIVDFFLDLMEGRVEDAKLCHRIDAAKQLVKYGYKKAADFIAEHGDEPCDHCESRKRGPRPRKDATPAAGPPYAAPHLTPDFLTLLTEDFFTVLTAVDEDLMIKLVRGQTRYGDSIVEFLDDVMQGRVEGFKPHHRIAAARELISHIIRDEHRSHTSGVPAHKIVVPAPSSVTPAHAGVQNGGAGRGACPEPSRRVVPAEAGFLPQEPSPTHPRLNGIAAITEEPQRLREGAARAAKLRKAQDADPIEEKKDEEPAPAELAPAERRISENIEAHRHEPDPYGAPKDSTTPGRSPPR